MGLGFFSVMVSRQGPWEQFLQQVPDTPMGHGFIVSALSKIVSTPSRRALAIICWLAGSTLIVLGSRGGFLALAGLALASSILACFSSAT